jgi:hypothetical protein
MALLTHMGEATLAGRIPLQGQPGMVAAAPGGAAGGAGMEDLELIP